MPDLQPRILGLGYFVPPSLLTNDDPIFDWIHNYLKENQNCLPTQADGPARSEFESL
jgi:hypothetical protein